jgi:thioredoxin 1
MIREPRRFPLISLLVLIPLAFGIFDPGFLHGQGRTPVISEPPPDTDEDLQKALKSGKPVVVDFGASSCVPCKKLRPILRALSKEYAGKAHFLIIDVYESRSLAREYRIQLIPTLIFFDNQGKEVYRHMGFWDKDSIVKKLKEIGKIG